MLIQHNYLRLFRKRSHLTQSDIAYILQLPDYANVSRWEQGHRKPNLETLITYHLLFNIPIESLFERQRHELKGRVKERLAQRISELKTLSHEPKVDSRIRFLDSILSRLNIPSPSL